MRKRRTGDARMVDVYDTSGCTHLLMSCPLSVVRSLFDLAPAAMERLDALFTPGAGIFVVDFCFNHRTTPLGFNWLYFKRGDIKVTRLVQITSVDMNGFCGRDLHPDDRKDIGRVMVVDKVEFCDDEEGNDEFDAVCFTCHDIEHPDYKLELMDHEIDAV
jgi:hypothetical protein